MTYPAKITCHQDDGVYQLNADRGTMRMLLMCALADANLWTRAVGASVETKNHWARRATLIRGLLEQMPPPANPRDPYEDLPGEPTPEEAEARWRERAAADDARRDAAKVAVLTAAERSYGEDAAAALLTDEPCFECGSTERIGTACAPCNPEITDPAFGLDDDIEDLLAL